MVDRQGRVTSRFFEDYYWERNTISNVMLRLGAGGSPVQATEASTQHLELKAYPSDASVALGTRFSLVLDVTPKQGMHVYAPGAAGYKVIALTITPQPHVRTASLRYPASTTYFFKPLNERVPVYQKPFSLVMEVVPEATAEARKALGAQKELIISGMLEYQACDDMICYNPVSLPLSWKIELHELVPGSPQPPSR
jgi:DsbC/DsbD-like thiol-disulfide interchange protein